MTACRRWETLKTLVVELTHGYGDSHDFRHAEKVATNAATILDRMTSNEDIVKLRDEGVKVRDIVIASAWVHDVLDHKMVKSPEEYKEKEEKLRVYLYGHLEEGRDIVFDIINNVSFSKEKKGLKKDLGKYEILRNIVSDADKLEAIGKAGIKRCYQYRIESGLETDKDLIIKEMKEHCEEKLMLLYNDYIRTKPGKDLGKEKHQDVVDFYNGQLSLDSVLDGS